MHEHDDEPVPGLPQALPDGERILWQGRADARSLAITALHVRKLAVYFAALLLLRLAFKLADGIALAEAISGSLVLVLLAAAAVGLLAWYAKKAAAASMFTITNRRIVLRCGVAVSVTINLPFAVIDAVELRLREDGTGDIAIRTDRGSRVSYILLWPMVRPFRLFDVRPVLRSVPDSERVASVLKDALAEFAVDAKAQALRLASGSPEPADEKASPPLPPFRPHYPLAAAASLVVISILAVSLHQLFGPDDDGALDEPVVASVELFFEDLEDGSVAVVDAGNGMRLDTLDPGSNGFVRGALRSLARERRAASLDDTEPFEVRRTQSGRVILRDTATGRVIDLRAFGETNREAFERFLKLRAGEEDTRQSSLAADDVTAVALQQGETRQ